MLKFKLLRSKHLDAYGRVWFANNQRGKYIRIDTDTKSSELSDLFTKVYNLSTPGTHSLCLASLLLITTLFRNHSIEIYAEKLNRKVQSC